MDANRSFITGTAPLHLIRQFSSLSMVQLLLETGVSVTAKDENVNTSLHAASEYEDGPLKIGSKRFDVY